MLIPLDMLKPGEWAEIAEIGGDAAWVCRLAELGLREGCKLQMQQPGSTCLLKIADCRLCLRSGESARILVLPVRG